MFPEPDIYMLNWSQRLRIRIFLLFINLVNWLATKFIRRKRGRFFTRIFCQNWKLNRVEQPENWCSCFVGRQHKLLKWWWGERLEVHECAMDRGVVVRFCTSLTVFASSLTPGSVRSSLACCSWLCTGDVPVLAPAARSPASFALHLVDLPCSGLKRGTRSVGPVLTLSFNCRRLCMTRAFTVGVVGIVPLVLVL